MEYKIYIYIYKLIYKISTFRDIKTQPNRNKTQLRPVKKNTNDMSSKTTNLMQK